MLSYIPNGTYALDCWMEQICSLVFVTLYWKYEVWASSTRDIHRKLDINQSLSWTRNQVNFFRKVCFTLNLNISHIVFRQYFHEFLRFGDSYPHTRYSKCKFFHVMAICTVYSPLFTTPMRKSSHRPQLFWPTPFWWWMVFMVVPLKQLIWIYNAFAVSDARNGLRTRACNVI